ncbi:unnamed protein product, partial [Iphiclides podalirius]
MLTQSRRSGEQLARQVGAERARLARVSVRVEALRARERHLPAAAPVHARARPARRLRDAQPTYLKW